MSGVVALVVDFGSHAAWFSLISWAGRGLAVGLLRSRTMAHAVIKKDGAKSHCWLITMHCRKHVKMQLARRPLQTVHSAKSRSSQYSTPQGVTAALNMAADRCRHVYLTMENAHGHATTGYQHSSYYCPLAAVRCCVHISRTYPQSVARPCWRYWEHATSLSIQMVPLRWCLESPRDAAVGLAVVPGHLLMRLREDNCVIIVNMACDM